jgi:Helix-turn-helix domain
MEKINPELPSVFLVLADLVKQMHENQRAIMDKLHNLNTESPTSSEYITATEFMDALRIRRSKFDELRHQNLIKTLEKGRKIYVPSSEIKRYFEDNSIK